ncbi:AAA family ATPase [bacterium]|nr:AAA family ATPase [bacterium]
MAVLFIPPPKSTYTASAMVEMVKENATSEMMFTDAMFFGNADDIATQAEIITSQRIIFLAAQRIGIIDSTLAFEDINNHPEYFNKLDYLKSSCTANPVELAKARLITDIIKVTVTVDESELAIGLVNSIADVYKEESKKQKKGEIEEIRNFLEAQLGLYRSNLEGYQDTLLKHVEKALPVVNVKGEDILDLQRTYGSLIEEINNLKQLKKILIERKNGEIDGVDWMAVVYDYIEFNKLFARISNLEDAKSKQLDYQFENSEPVMELERKIQALIDAILSGVNQDLNKLKEQADATLKLMETNIEYRHLKREVELNASIVEHLQLSFQDALVKDSRGYDLVRILEYATYPKESSGPSRLFGFVIAIIFGLLAGTIIAAILESFDTSIRVVEDVENFLDLPVLSVIPHITPKSLENKQLSSKQSPDKKSFEKLKLGLITHFAPKSPIAESYRTLRTNLDLKRSQSACETILFTSSAMREGKSTTITNLAITIAQIGNRVLLIGCNLRRPSIYRTFNIDKKPGVTDIILGTVAWQDTVKNVTDMFVNQAVEITDVLFSPGLDNLDIITAGATPSNPSELLSTPKFRQFISEVREVYDIVLIDAPPTLPVTDAAIIAPMCDQVILVYQIGRISRDALARTKSHLDNVDAKITGIVLNDIKAELKSYSYDSAYTTPYYGEDSKKEESKKKSIWSLN